MCPACGARTLWAALAAFAPACGTCGQDFARAEPRGRTLFLVVVPVTALLTGGALKFDALVHPPALVLAALALAVVPATMITALRLAKAAALIGALRAKDER